MRGTDPVPPTRRAGEDDAGEGVPTRAESAPCTAGGREDTRERTTVKHTHHVHLVEPLVGTLQQRPQQREQTVSLALLALHPAQRHAGANHVHLVSTPHCPHSHPQRQRSNPTQHTLLVETEHDSPPLLLNWILLLLLSFFLRVLVLLALASLHHNPLPHLHVLLGLLCRYHCLRLRLDLAQILLHVAREVVATPKSSSSSPRHLAQQVHVLREMLAIQLNQSGQR